MKNNSSSKGTNRNSQATNSASNSPGLNMFKRKDSTFALIDGQKSRNIDMDKHRRSLALPLNVIKFKKT